MNGSRLKIACGVVALTLLCSYICGCGVGGDSRTLEDFLQEFEKKGYVLEFKDGSIADAEEDMGVSGMIATYAEYSCEREDSVDGNMISDAVTFYYIKCVDEEKAAIVFDAVVYDKSLEEGERETNGDNQEKTTYDYDYSWDGYDGLFYSSSAGFSRGREIVSRCGSVIIYLDMNYTDYVKADAPYQFIAEEALDQLGF